MAFCLEYAQELEDRIELHELDSSERVEFFFGHQPESFFHHSFGSPVAVGVRIPQDSIVLSDQTEIHPPGIHSKTRQLPVTLLSCAGQPLFQFTKKIGNIPMNMPGDIELRVRETVNLFQADSVFIENPK
ncbi:hypothetical protein ES703_117941 [subsurface metagenome]